MWAVPTAVHGKVQSLDLKVLLLQDITKVLFEGGEAASLSNSLE